MVNLGTFSGPLAAVALIALPAAADAFDVFQERCVVPMFAFEDFSGEGLLPTDTDRASLTRFVQSREPGQITMVSFDAEPPSGRRACVVFTEQPIAPQFEAWIADLEMRDALERDGETRWLTGEQIEPRLALEIMANDRGTTLILTETNLESGQDG